MNTSLKKTLIEGVIAELVQFSVHSKKEAVYLRFIFNCCARHPMYIKINGEYIIKKTLIECLPFVPTHAKISNVTSLKNVDFDLCSVHKI